MSYKNRGVIIGQRETDYVAGAGSPIPYVVNVPDGNWKPYEPTPENQYGTGGDRKNCVTQSMQNAIKMILNEQIINKKLSILDIEWLNINGYIDQFGKVQFSVRFNSITNGTNPDKGNWLYLVADDARNTGLIPERMIPDDNSISKAEYYNPKVITQKMRDMGQEFIKRFSINYEWIDATIPELMKHLKQAPIQIVINQGTHAVAEILQLSDIYKYFDSYPPYEVTRSSAVMPWTPLKYVITYNQNNNTTMFKLLGEESTKRQFVIGVDKVAHHITPQLLKDLHSAGEVDPAKMVWVDNLAETDYTIGSGWGVVI